MRVIEVRIRKQGILEFGKYRSGRFFHKIEKFLRDFAEYNSEGPAIIVEVSHPIHNQDVITLLGIIFLNISPVPENCVSKLGRETYVMRHTTLDNFGAATIAWYKIAGGTVNAGRPCGKCHITAGTTELVEAAGSLNAAFHGRWVVGTRVIDCYTFAIFDALADTSCISRLARVTYCAVC